MAVRTYTYVASNIIEPGKDRMRFELGDTMVEGKAETCALTDEEIICALEMKVYVEDWHMRLTRLPARYHLHFLEEQSCGVKIMNSLKKK